MNKKLKIGLIIGSVFIGLVLLTSVFIFFLMVFPSLFWNIDVESDTPEGYESFGFYEGIIDIKVPDDYTAEIENGILFVKKKNYPDFMMLINVVSNYGMKSPELTKENLMEKIIEEANKENSEISEIKEININKNIIYYIEGIDNNSNPNDPEDYPLLKQGHVIAENDNPYYFERKTLYFTILYRPGSEEEVNQAIDILGNAKLRQPPY